MDEPSTKFAKSEKQPPAPVPAIRTWLPMGAALWFWKNARKVVVLVVSVTILLLGVAMLALPGPGWVTIFGGLALLATEFTWARWILKHARERFELLKEAAINTWNNGPAVQPPPRKGED